MENSASSLIVLSGAGTSGRLAYLCCHQFNRILEALHMRPCFRYLIAGGDPALVRPVEGAEDDPQRALQDLIDCIHDSGTAPKSHLLYIGITCGFSAPYIAGQLDFMIQHYGGEPLASAGSTDRPSDLPSHGFACLLGFNPVERARRNLIEGWHCCFHDVAVRLQALVEKRSSQFIILNPVVGPEPITGSTRMKGGTATKFLLDAALAQALDTFRPATLVDLAFATASRLPDDTVATTRSLSLRTFLAFERTARAVYLCPPGSTTHPLARAVALAGDAIARGGHLYYLGVGIHGILGLIDASECPPTFGAALDDVRGFVQGGWAALGTQGAGVGVPFVDPVEGHLFRLDLADFEREFVGRLTERDVVVAGGLLGGGCVVEGRTDSGERASLARLIDSALSDEIIALLRKCSTARRILVALRPPGVRTALPDVPVDVTVELPLPCGIAPIAGLSSFADLAAKLSFNALTTGAHILAGKVYQNYMIDVQITNHKLFQRAVNIVRTTLALGGRIITLDESRCLLLASIYRCEPAKVGERVHADCPVGAHVRAAAAPGISRIVPLAVLLGHGLGLAEALDLLAKERIVKRLIIKMTRTTAPIGATAQKAIN